MQPGEGFGFGGEDVAGEAGVGGDSLSSIFSTAGKTIYGIGTLTQPLFEGGKLRGQLQLSQETKQEMVLTYQKTIAGAFRDVSNALIAAFEASARHCRRSSGSTMARFAFDSRISTIG